MTAAVLNWSEVGEHVIAGKVRALATMALQRIEPLPDLPTVSESGYKDFETDVWFGLVAPAKTPKETVVAAHRLVPHGAACAGGQERSSRRRRSIPIPNAAPTSTPTCSASPISTRG